MYLIIIADIAPMMPGSLAHFNWPRLLRKYLDIQGLFTNPIIKGLTNTAQPKNVEKENNQNRLFHWDFRSRKEKSSLVGTES